MPASGLHPGRCEDDARRPSGVHGVDGSADVRMKRTPVLTRPNTAHGTKHRPTEPGSQALQARALPKSSGHLCGQLYEWREQEFPRRGVLHMWTTMRRALCRPRNSGTHFCLSWVHPWGPRGKVRVVEKRAE